MNKKVWLSTLLASLGAGAVLAQNTNMVVPANPPTNSVAPSVLPPVTNVPAVAPTPVLAPTDVAAPAVDAAAPKKEKKKVVAKKPVAKLVSSGLAASHVPVDPPVSATVKVDALNVRGLPSTSGEVITKLHKGDAVTVTEEISLDKVHSGEPAKWARILLPTNTAVWVSAHLVDTNKMTVNAKKLNVRGGPGENFNVIGHLDKGSAIKQIRVKEGWMQIEPPANASAYVSLDLIDKSSSGTPAPVVPTPAPVIEPAPIAANPTPAPDATPLPPPTVVQITPEPNTAVQPATDVPPVTPVPAPTPAPVTEPAPVVPTPAPVVVAPEPVAPDQATNDLPKRVVTREGVVRISHNIQAPTYYELRDSKSSELIDYLSPTKNEMDLRSYVGKKVVVSGQESMDRRWKFTPVVEVESIDLP